MKGRLRYGLIHPDIRAAARAKTSTPDTMKAFAEHPSQEAQREVFEALAKDGGYLQAYTVRHGWRQRCRDWAAIPDYEEGDKIRLVTPVTLTDGSTCQIVTATHYRRGRQKRRCYRIEETGGLVRLSKAPLAGSELLSSAKGAASPVLAEYFAARE